MHRAPTFFVGVGRLGINKNVASRGMNNFLLWGGPLIKSVELSLSIQTRCLTYLFLLDWGQCYQYYVRKFVNSDLWSQKTYYSIKVVHD